MTPDGPGTLRAGAVIVGAGGGRRLGGVEKAFLEVAGQPLIAQSLAAFERTPTIHAICLVVSDMNVVRARTLVQAGGWGKVVAIVPGGAERQDSVRVGLEALTGCDLVAVHDAARPLVDQRAIALVIQAAAQSGAAIAASPVRDTLKRASSAPAGDAQTVAVTVDRSGMWAAQTPQVFRRDLLLRAFREAGSRASTFTDDASLVEALGYPVQLVDTGVINLKVTYPEDVPLVEALLRARAEGRL